MEDLALARLTNAHHGDIEGAAAEVEDEDVLRLLHCQLVVQCGDGFEFEGDLAEAGEFGGAAQSLLGGRLPASPSSAALLPTKFTGRPSVTPSTDSPVYRDCLNCCAIAATAIPDA